MSHRATAAPRVRLVAATLAAAVVAGGLSLAASPIASAATTTLPTLPRIMDGRVQAFATIGSEVFVGGTFTKLTLQDGTAVTQPGLFGYNLNTGVFDNSFRPTIAGGKVLALAPTSDGSAITVGGTFKSVNGVAQARLARINLDGSLGMGFRPTVNSLVSSLSITGNRLFVGGQFSKISGTTRNLLAELDATTGAVATGFNFPITGSAAVGGFATVQALSVSPDGTKLLVAHNAAQVAGQDRYGVAVIDLTAGGGTLDPWYTTIWQDNLFRNGGVVRVTNAAWGPDSTWFVTTNTGGDRPPTNDSVQRFDLSGPGPVDPTWITRQFDSSYSVAIAPDGTVYTGGHFRYTEAPGSTEPWPGDDNTNYGFGPAGGARRLGSEVVGRMQIDALDPTTGKALNWYGTADGQHGVTALDVVGNVLLVGHDGQRVGGFLYGKHGQLPAYDASRDTSVPMSTTSTPLMGEVDNVGIVHATGTASAPAGVSKVTVEVKKGTQWLHADGTFGTFYAFTAALASPGATSTTWSLDVNLAQAGDYTLTPKTTDTAKLNEVNRISVPFQTNDPSNSPPTLTITAPADGKQDFTSSTTTATGTVTDPDGVAAVEVAFYNVTQQGYLNSDGTIADYQAFTATLGAPNANGLRNWSYTATLPDGEYNMFVNAVDTKGASLPRALSRSFTMSPGNPPPSVTITSPANGSGVSTPATFAGTATDDTAVNQVWVHIADTRFGFGPQPAGSFGNDVWQAADLTTGGAASTDWSLTVPNLPPGVYTVSVYAQDDAGVVTATNNRPTIQVRSGATNVATEPQTTISTPNVSTFRPGDLTIPVAGTASYAVGVQSVSFVVRDQDAGGYLQGDGTLKALPYYFTAPVDNPGATSSTWSSTLSVPWASHWRVDALAVGTDGVVDWTQSGARNIYIVFPGDADPTIEWNSPLTGAVIPGRQISAGGRAFDDKGVAGVQLLIRTTASSGLRTDGTIGTPQWVNAFITNPGGLFTNWNYVSPKIPAGTWLISARTVDSVGKTMLTWETRTVTVTN